MNSTDLCSLNNRINMGDAVISYKRQVSICMTDARLP